MIEGNGLLRDEPFDHSSFDGASVEWTQGLESGFLGGVCGIGLGSGFEDGGGESTRHGPDGGFCGREVEIHHC